MSRGWQPELHKLARLPGIEIVAKEFRSEKASILAVVRDLTRLTKSCQVSVAYSTHLHVNALLGLMRRLKLLTVKRLVARESTQIFERFYGVKRWLFRCMYRVGYGSQDLLIFQTREMSNSLQRALGAMPVAKFEVIPNPVDIKHVSSCLSDVPHRSGGTSRVVACGRFVDIKGFEKLIMAFGTVSDEFPTYQLELIGSGPLDDRLRQVALCTGSGRIVFHGLLENPFNELFEADVGIISSEREGFPNVLLEMMACSVHRIVSTPCTGAVTELPGVIIADDSGVESLGNALRLAMTLNEDRSDSYRKFLEQNHSLQRFAEKVTGYECTP